ncbi:MAG: hypothetical protein SH856_14160 [Flavobacteriales bacterium]|nr:hypothetical protein [Flavobacteriales bacterium]
MIFFRKYLSKFLLAALVLAFVGARINHCVCDIHSAIHALNIEHQSHWGHENCTHHCEGGKHDTNVPLLTHHHQPCTHASVVQEEFLPRYSSSEKLQKPANTSHDLSTPEILSVPWLGSVQAAMLHHVHQRWRCCLSGADLRILFLSFLN